MVVASAGNGDGSATPTPGQMFNQLPIITRMWLGAALSMTLTANFKIMDVYQTFWVWENVKSKLELYRILTCLCYGGGFSMKTFFLFFNMVIFSQQYEKGVPFNTGAGGGTADYAFCWLLGAIGCLLTYPFVISVMPPYFFPNMVHYVIYVWSKKHPNSNSNIWGIPVRGLHLPFIFLALTVFMGENYFPQLHGMVLGHLYYFTVEVVPIVYGKDILHTPKFLIDYFGFDSYQPDRPLYQGRGRWDDTTRNNSGNNVNTIHTPTNSNSNSNSNSNTTNNRSGGGHNWGSGGTRLGAS